MRMFQFAVVTVIVLGSSVVSLGPGVLAAPFTLVHTLNNPTPNSGDRFGNSVAISGNKLLAGSVFDDRLFTDTGRAYVFDVPSGVRTLNINNPLPSTGDHFGGSADIDGNLGVIGSHFENVGGALRAGRAYVYDMTTGALLRTINNPEASTDDLFGDASAISGNKVLVGARNGDAGGTNVGGAYLFDAISGSLLHTFNNPNPVSGDLYGFDLDLNGNVVAVSAERQDTGATDAGAVYLFDATTGNLTHSLFNPNPGANDVFGQSLNVFNDRVLVGATGDDTTGIDSGSAYLFDAVTGNVLHTFANPTANAGDGFGSQVAMNDDYIVITAGGDDTAGLNSGSAYIYDAMTFSLLQTITNPIPSDTGFGGGSGVTKISLGTDWLAISNATGTDSGRIFLYASSGVPAGGALPVFALGLLGLAYRRRGKGE